MVFYSYILSFLDSFKIFLFTLLLLQDLIYVHFRVPSYKKIITKYFSNTDYRNQTNNG